MKKAVASALLAVVMTATLQTPSHASEMSEKLMKFPVTMTSFFAGVAVGTPIAMTRKAASSAKETKESIADDKGAFGTMAGYLIGVPVGIVKGTFQGLVLGPKNAYNNSSDSPFSSDVFSMGDLD